MVARVEKTAEGYVVPLTAEMMDRLHLAEGAEVELRPLNGTAQTAVDGTVSRDEALRLYEASKERFDAAYEALAK